MGLFSPSKRELDADGAERVRAAPSAEPLQTARTRARRRLIGAVALLAVGIVGFPLLFDGEPRPLPLDLPIDIPRPDAVPPLKAPSTASTTSSSRGRPVGTSELPSDALRSAAGAPSSESDAVDEMQLAEAAIRRPPVAASGAAVPRTAMPPGSAPRTAPVAAAAAPAASRPAPSSAASDGEAARYVVQVGAFAEDEKARDARAKVERLGLKTYEQTVDTPAGRRTRVRVGPYASKDEADKSASRVKAGGLPAVVLVL